MKRNPGTFANPVIIFFALLLSPILLTHCSFKELSEETPAPYEERFSKDFFVNFKTDGVKASITGHKDFICGWAAHRSAGRYRGINQYNYPVAWLGCNVRFFIEEDFVIGKSIHTSHPDEPARWKDLVRIPIINHHYYEKSRDGRGRESKVLIENSSRSHWSARPYMRLDLKNIQILDPSLKPLLGSTGVPSDLTDVEKDDKNGFLGFTITTQHGGVGSQFQGQFRFNFKAFVHDKEFKPTPFHDENSKYVAPVFISGYRKDMSRPKMFVPRWDTKKTHEVQLKDFPPEYQHMGFEVVKNWNDVFEKLGHGRPFKAVLAPENRKYGFDLRYTTLNWIEETSLNVSRGLFGIAGQMTDLRNGKILWGTVNLYGDNIRKYINNQVPSVSVETHSAKLENGEVPKEIQLSLMEPQSILPETKMVQPIELTWAGDSDLTTIKDRIKYSYGLTTEAYEAQLEKLKAGNLEALIDLTSPNNESVWANGSDYFNPAKDRLRSSAEYDPEKPITAAELTDIVGYLSKYIIDVKLQIEKNIGFVDQIAKEYIYESSKLKAIQEQYKSTDNVYNKDMLQNLIGQPVFKSSLQKLIDNNEHLKGQINEHSTHLEIAKALDPVAQPKAANDMVFDSDWDIAEKGQGWLNAISGNYVSPLDAEKRAMKFTLLHEFGHMIGMHHNFKENILPKKGDVPDSIRDPLVAKDQDNNRVFHTVMGYPNGFTEVITPYEEILPGYSDYLVLNYIYNRKYPIYPVNAKGSEPLDFVELDVNGNGLIKERQKKNGQEYKVAFLPHCFVGERQYDDPYCAARDRGSNSLDLVKNYFEEYAGNLMHHLFSFSNTTTGGNYRRRESYLWWNSLRTFARTRVFYDYMRQTYETQIRELVSPGGEEAAQNLLEFADSCEAVYNNKPVVNATATKILSRPENRELLELCMATSHMIKEFEFYLTLAGRDYTELNYKDKYYSSPNRVGDSYDRREFMARAYGSWTSLSRTPIKISALLALTSPFPYTFRWGWVIPIHQYSRKDGAFHISTLFSQQFASAISSATEMNLSIGNEDLGEVTAITDTILSMGYFLRNTYKSNDILKTYQPFIENIRDQTKYRYSLAFVEVNRDETTEGDEIAKKFSGKIHNIYNKGPENVPEIYMYSNDRVVLLPPPRSLILPLSPVRWYTNKAGYLIAIKLDYASDFYDRLRASSVRQIFKEMYYNVMKSCIQGTNRNGLKYFFNENIDEFPGFVFPANIHDGGDTPKNRYFESLEKQFRRYNVENVKGFDPAPKASTCEEALRAQGLLVMAASALNGLYFRNISDYIEKGYAW